MSGENTRSCQVPVSTIFVFNTPQFQNAANTVYEQKKAFDNSNNATTTGNTYKFKSDFERMQYLLGLYGRDSVGRR
jgi:hypothetical protein